MSICNDFYQVINNNGLKLNLRLFCENVSNKNIKSDHSISFQDVNEQPALSV